MAKRNYSGKMFDEKVTEVEARAEELLPDTIYLSLAVCAGTSNSCGWVGWLLEAAFQENNDNSLELPERRTVATISNQDCPRCGEQVFRTLVRKRFVPKI